MRDKFEMETQLITKKIKDLADECNKNVDYLNRKICRYTQNIIDLKKENTSLKYGIQLERWARASAEKKSETSILCMLIFAIVTAVIIAYKTLTG